MADCSACYVISAEREFPDPIDAEVHGKIPSWISGSLYRNGPAKFEVGKDEYNHYFDGLAMVQKFTIKDGNVQYRNKFLRSNTYNRNMAANRIVVTEFGTMAHPDPCQSIFKRYFTLFKFEFTDNTSVNVFPIGDELYCATETNFINKIDPESLDVIERLDLKKIVAVGSATAHPHSDMDGTIYNLGTTAGEKGPEYCIVRIPPKPEGSDEHTMKHATICSKIPSRWRFTPGYMHSFGMSENFFVVAETPLGFSIPKILKNHFLRIPYNTAVEWNENVPTLIHLMSKENGEEVQCYEAPGFFTFHHINAYEDDGHVVVDMVCYDSGKIIQQIDKESFSRMSTLASEHPPIAKRYVLPLDCKNKEPGENLVKLMGSKATASVVKDKPDTVLVQPEQLNGTPIEMPRIHYERSNARNYQYFYGIAVIDPNDGMERLIKCDVKTGQSWTWCEADCYPSEPVFVPSPEATLEDEGVILSPVIRLLDDGKREQFLLILDAQTMKELGRATTSQVSVPKTFHGSFVDGQF